MSDEDRYAPVAVDDLATSGHEAWVLGHLHVPGTRHDNPPVLYPGSLQPLDPSETGGHGAWLLSVETDGTVDTEPLDSATLHYEEVTVSTAPDEGFHDIVDATHNQLRDAVTECGTETELLAVNLVGESRRIELNGDVAEHIRDGASADPIPVPSLHGGRRYSLLHDMLQEETDDGEFANVIQRESTGGFNIDAVREKFGLSGGASSATRGISETQEAGDAIERVEELRREAPDLEEERARLSRLEEELSAAAAARERVNLLETAIEYKKAQDDYDQQVEKLESFPDELESFDGDELEQLETLEDQIEKQKRQDQEAAAKYREAAETLAGTELPEDGVSDEDLQTLREHRDNLADAEDDRDRLEREVAEATTERDEIRKKIPLDLDDKTLREVETEDLAELRSFVSKVAEVEGKKWVKAAIDDWLGDDSEDQKDREALESGRNALENWLAAQSEQATDDQQSRGPVVAAVAAGILTALSGGVIALLVHSFSTKLRRRKRRSSDCQNSSRNVPDQL
ncbi:hypothetical protein [Halomicrobium urmianum]|uniref:hypothetical protein n=1 Tax=Halomicrobium urmianum TaxID=1586233 RepID=UPI001CD9DB8B|nr:hypothetical protein [Halomicrobium urmianum]